MTYISYWHSSAIIDKLEKSNALTREDCRKEFICHVPVSVSYLHTLEHPTAHYISLMQTDQFKTGKVVVMVGTGKHL